MAVIYSNATVKFLQELTKQQKMPHNPSERHLKTPRQLKGVRKFYENDTSKFEPIPENREHLIKTLMPMVVKMAKEKAEKYHGRIEYNDCINQGMIGATIATDLYIKRSAIEEQPAKLSTFAHSYITKYINEYCYGANTILSHGPTKGGEAASFPMMSGNQTYNEEGRSVEFFDIANDDNLMHVDNHDAITEDVDHVSCKLFQSLSTFDKEVIFLSFGIGSDISLPMKANDIAKRLKCSAKEVSSSLEKSILSMRSSIADSEIAEVVRTLRSTDLSMSTQWQRTS